MSIAEKLADDPTQSAQTRRPVREISKRVGLPSSRAVVGAVLITLAIAGLFTAFGQSQTDPRSPYVVVSSTVAAGAEIRPDDVAVRLLDLGELADRTLTSVDQAIGATAIQTLLPGRVLQQPDLLETSVGSPSPVQRSFEVSFGITESRALLGQLTPGELVDVVATFGVDGESCTSVVVPAAQVVGVSSRGQGQFGSDDSVDLTLAVPDNDEVLGLVLALDEADVTVVRATRADGTHLSGSVCTDAALERGADGES